MEGWVRGAVGAPLLWVEKMVLAWEVWELGVLAREGSTRGDASSASKVLSTSVRLRREGC